MWLPSGVPFMTVPTALGLWWHSPCFTHTGTHTRWWALWLRWLSLVPGPRRDGEGPESHRQPLCCRRGNQPLYVRHVFLFVFFFMSLMWARGMFPLSSTTLHPPHPSTLHCVAPPPTPTNHTHLPSPPTNSSTFVSPLRLLFSLMLSPPHPLCFPLEIVICKALCLDSPYLCRGVAASLSLSSFLSVLREGLAQAGTFSSSCTEKKRRKRRKNVHNSKTRKPIPKTISPFPR